MYLGGHVLGGYKRAFILGLGFVNVWTEHLRPNHRFSNDSSATSTVAKSFLVEEGILRVSLKPEQVDDDDDEAAMKIPGWINSIRGLERRLG